MKTVTGRQEFHSKNVKKTTTAMIHTEQAEQLRRFADVAKISVSQLIRQIVGAWLADRVASGHFGQFNEEREAVAYRRRNG
jgi:capsid protein